MSSACFRQVAILRYANRVRSIVHVWVEIDGGILIYNTTGSFCGPQGGPAVTITPRQRRDRCWDQGRGAGRGGQGRMNAGGGIFS